LVVAQKQLVVLANNLAPSFRAYFNNLAAQPDSPIEIIPSSIGVFNGNHYELETNQEAFAELWYQKPPKEGTPAWADYIAAFEEHKNKIAGQHIIFIQSMAGNVGRHIEETAAFATICEEFGVGSWEIFETYAPYGRQDKLDEGRIGSLQGKYYPIRLKRDGWSKITALECHSDKAQSYYTDKEVFGPNNAVFLSPAGLYAGDLKARGFTPENTAILAPDGADKLGDAGQRRAHDVGRIFYDAASFTPEEDDKLFPKLLKKRSPEEKAGTNSTVLTWDKGDVTGKRCVIVDDVGDSLGTVCDAAKLLREHGAASVDVYLSYQGGDTGRLEEALFKKNFNGQALIDHVTFLDACPVINKHVANLAGMTHDDGSLKYPDVHDRVSIMTCAPLFAQQIQKMQP
jgi:phosphoribosylpyrophosphate synthetase